MKNISKQQQHPHQEDKTGKPMYASRTRINYSTNDPRTNEEETPVEVQKFKFIRVRLRKRK